MRHKQYLIIAAFLFLSASSTSNAGISLNQSNVSVPAFDFNKVFNGVSLPQTDFTKNARQTDQGVSNLPLQKYKTDIARFVDDLKQNNLVKSVYSFFIGIVKLIGGIVIWVLEFILVIIRRGLSFIS